MAAVQKEIATLKAQEDSLDQTMGDLGEIAARLQGSEYRHLHLVFSAGLRVQRATIALRVREFGRELLIAARAVVGDPGVDVGLGHGSKARVIET